MSNKRPNVSDVAKALRSDPERYATMVLGEPPTQRLGTEVRYFENGSLRLGLTGPYAGRFQSFVDEDAHGDIFDLIIWHRGLSSDKAGKEEARKIALAMIGGTMSVEDISKVKEKTDAERQEESRKIFEKKKKAANWIWNNSSSTDGKAEGLEYLRGRGIDVDLPEDVVRFRRLSRDDLSRMKIEPEAIPDTPVVSLVFAARDKAGDIQAVQQVLTTEGKKLKGVPKLTNGVMNGAAVHLPGRAHTGSLAIVEGPETGLSVWQATGMGTSITLGKANFTKVWLPDNTESVITVSDMEGTGAGLCAALRAAQVWKDRGIQRSGIALPPELNEGDYNDVLQIGGNAAVARGIEHTFFPPEREKDGTVVVSPDARALFHVWSKTGLEVAPKQPSRDKEGNWRGFSVENLVEPHHDRVLIIGHPSFEIRTEALARSRPEVEIITLHEDSRDFRAEARDPDKLRKMLDAVDLYAPKGLGEKEPLFFALRRDDADALDLEGYLPVAVRARSTAKVDLSFVRGRRTIVAPVGAGTASDRVLSDRLEQAGANVTRLTWQIFRGDEHKPRIIRKTIPRDYGARDARNDGWQGEALRDLIEISRVNHDQIQVAPKVKASKKEQVTR